MIYRVKGESVLLIMLIGEDNLVSYCLDTMVVVWLLSNESFSRDLFQGLY